MTEQLVLHQRDDSPDDVVKVERHSLDIGLVGKVDLMCDRGCQLTPVSSHA